MSLSPVDSIHRVIILHQSRIAVVAIIDRIRMILPAASITAVSTIQLAVSALVESPADLLLTTDIGLHDGDALDLIFRLGAFPQVVRRFMVVTAEKALHVLSTLR